MLSKTFYRFNSYGAPQPQKILLYQPNLFTVRYYQRFRTTDLWILHRKFIQWQGKSISPLPHKYT
jgi:hypothetical protein